MVNGCNEAAASTCVRSDNHAAYELKRLAAFFDPVFASPALAGLTGHDAALQFFPTRPKMGGMDSLCITGLTEFRTAIEHLPGRKRQWNARQEADRPTQSMNRNNLISALADESAPSADATSRWRRKARTTAYLRLFPLSPLIFDRGVLAHGLWGKVQGSRFRVQGCGLSGSTGFCPKNRFCPVLPGSFLGKFKIPGSKVLAHGHASGLGVKVSQT